MISVTCMVIFSLGIPLSIQMGIFHLIDLELSVNVNDPETTYRGALVHLFLLRQPRDAS